MLLLIFYFSKIGYCETYQVENQKKITEDIELFKIKYKNHYLDYLLLKDLSKVAFDIGFANSEKFNFLDTVNNISKKNNAIAAVNLSYFGYSHNKFQNGDIRGVCVYDGKLLSSKCF